MRNRILVTGGTGKTGRRVADLLAQRGAEHRVATRTPRGSDQVRFDWLDSSSFDDALDGVRAIYMVAPADVVDLLPAMRPAMEQALSNGVERLVLLSASSLDEGGPMMGAVHGWLRSNATGWTVLRPTWFMQNFSEHQHLHTIRDEASIYSATEDGRVPFIDAGDIAAVAVEALIDRKFANGDRLLTGPEALTYDEVAELISAASGRRIAHRRLSTAEIAKRFEAVGLPTDYADALARMDEAISRGAEDRITGEVERAVGHKPSSFRSFAESNSSAWR